MRREKTKPQTATIISLWFWGLLTCPELYCDWPVHNQHSWNFSGVHFFWSLTVSKSRKTLYYHFLSLLERANTNFIVKFNLRSGKEEAQIRISDYAPRKPTYQWGGYSGVDLAVDENGLWVLWGSTGNSYRLHASKINVQKNSITHTWSLNTGMSTTNRFLSKTNK